MESRVVRTPDGRELEVFDCGAADGVPVLVHHGTPSSGLPYAPHVGDAEARGIRLVGYSRPGYGRSTPHPGRTVADAAGDVEAICDALGLGRICTWGISGGGPHALACAALLPERVAAAASLASVAPYDAEGLDWLAGMGRSNLDEFAAVRSGRRTVEAFVGRERDKMLAATPEQLIEVWSTLLSDADAAVATGAFAEYVLGAARHGIGGRLDGWVDDDLAFARPWGFDVSQITVPLQLRQGGQDRFVPFAHGEWLAARIPGLDARLSAEDGHLTLIERRVPEVHAWLLERWRG